MGMLVGAHVLNPAACDANYIKRGSTRRPVLGMAFITASSLALPFSELRLMRLRY